jgi:hypothetical protein
MPTLDEVRRIRAVIACGSGQDLAFAFKIRDFCLLPHERTFVV